MGGFLCGAPAWCFLQPPSPAKPQKQLPKRQHREQCGRGKAVVTAKEQKLSLKEQGGFAVAHFGDCSRVYKLHPGAPTSVAGAGHPTTTSPSPGRASLRHQLQGKPTSGNLSPRHLLCLCIFLLSWPLAPAMIFLLLNYVSAVESGEMSPVESFLQICLISATLSKLQPLQRVQMQILTSSIKRPI